MTKEKWRVYNKEKQRLYRDMKRGKPPRLYTKIEDIMREAGHCGFCGMLLISKYHQIHPLIGCERYIREWMDSSKAELRSPKPSI